MLISNIHKSVIVINSIETRFSRKVFEVVPWGKIGFVGNLRPILTRGFAPGADD